MFWVSFGTHREHLSHILSSPSVITRRLAHFEPGEKVTGPDFKQLEPRHCPPRDGRQLWGAALNESPQWETFPALIQRSQMTRFSPGRACPCCHSGIFQPLQSGVLERLEGKMFQPHRTVSFVPFLMVPSIFESFSSALSTRHDLLRLLRLLVQL